MTNYGFGLKSNNNKVYNRRYIKKICKCAKKELYENRIPSLYKINSSLNCILLRFIEVYYIGVKIERGRK